MNKLVKNLMDRVSKAKESGKYSVTVRIDTARKIIESKSYATFQCDYSYTDDYAWDNANNFGKGELSHEGALNVAERWLNRTGTRCYITCDRPNELNITPYSNLSYTLYLDTNEVKPATKETESIETNQTNDNEMITLTIELNEELNGIELYFSSKPTQSVINQLKEYGFRWHKKGYWYAKQTPERLLIAESLVSIYKDIAADMKVSEPVEVVEQPETTNEQILISDSDLIGRKVFGQWGIGAGWDNGIITGETIYNEVIIKWEDGHEEYFELKNLVYVHENTNMDAVGVYLLPIETNENEQSEQVETIEETQQAEYTSDNKIKVSSIQFIWSESNEIEDGQTVSTFEEAEQLIKLAAHKAPDKGCYDKTKFNITWSDGQTYEGRIDIVKGYSFKSTPLKDHIVSFAKSVIEDDGTWHTDEQKESYKQFLETYSFTDDKQQEPTKQPAKVLDFSAKFKQKQEQKETESMTTHFIENVLPFMSMDEIHELKEAYESNNESILNQLWEKLVRVTTIRKVKEDVLKQN